MVQFGVFLFLLILLFLLSRLLHKELSRSLYALTKSQKATVNIVAFLFFPGTLLHELSHFLMAKLLFVGTGKIALLPQMEQNRVTLGSVQIEKTDPFRRLMIGGAPFLVGVLVIIILLVFSEQNQWWGQTLPTILIIYTLFEVGNTMFSSDKDMEGAFTVALFFLLFGGLLYFLGFQVFEAFDALISGEKIQLSLRQGSYYLLYPLGVNLLFLLTLRLLRMRRQ